MIKWPWTKQPAAPQGEPEKNDQVRAQLAQMGDSGRQPRHVVHYAYPEEEPGAWPKDKVKASFADLDIRFIDTEDNEGVIFEQQREVASRDFDEFTTTLSARFVSMGWDYDGWECAVEADSKV